MLELESLAKKHTAEYFRIKRLAKQQQQGYCGWSGSGACLGSGPGSGPLPALGGAQLSSPSSVESESRMECEEGEEWEREQLEEGRVVETFRVLIFPDQTFKDYLRSLGIDDLRKEFRRLAILIHPDKNQHPQAKVAFQKLYNSFVEVSQGSN